MAGSIDGPSALAALLSAYAGQDAARHRLIWTLDMRLAQIVKTTSEPMIGSMRLTWWSEALTDAAGGKGRGEPLIDALRAMDAAPPPGLTEWLDGWEALIGEVDLDAYASGRGGGLFRALAGGREIPDWLSEAGAVWALWDLSGHTGDAALAAEAVARAGGRLLSHRPRWPSAWRPMRIAYALARHDIMRGRCAPQRLTPQLYVRVLRAALTGR